MAGKPGSRLLYVDDSTGCVDVIMDPNNPVILYASMWQAHRTPYSLSSGGKGSGLYKSDDGGDTWKLISQNPGMPIGITGKVICTVSQANSNRLYAIVESKNGGVFSSKDAGKTWSIVSTQHDLTQRPWYFSGIYADPKNENTVYILNVEFWKSIDGGSTWSKIPNQHGDNHDMWINPDDPRNWIMGDDGGGQVTFDGGRTFTAQDFPTCQFYHINLDNDFPYHLYGAQQDNSSIRIASRTANSTIGPNDWFPVAGGEAGYIVPDPNNSDITYGGEYDGQLSTYNKKNDQYKMISVYPEQHDGEGAIVEKYRFNWTYPISFSPWDNNTLYVTSNHVHVSTDHGQTWKTISPDLTRHDPKTLLPSGGPITLDNTGAEIYATIFAFAESPAKQGVLWAGSDDGYVNVSQDNGSTWTNVTPKELPDFALISYVEPSHYDPAVCYVSATRYKSDDTKPYLFKTADYGKTWTLITTGLPQNIYTRCVREDPDKKGLLYCGTETGIYVSFNDGALWQTLQLNLPNTPVRDIQVQKRDKDLCIATHGRAFWILDDITPLYQVSDSIAKAKDWLYKPRDSYRTQGSQADDPVNDPTIHQGQNAPNGVVVYYYFKTKPKKEVRLIFFTDKGDTAITYSSLKNTKNEPLKIHKEYYQDRTAKHPGYLPADSLMNYFVWDMRYTEPKIDSSASINAGGPSTGALAVPGTYRVKLLLGDTVLMQQSFNIIEDPRVPATTADLQEEFAYIKKVNDKLNDIGKATKKIRSINSQVNNFLSTFTDSVTAKPYKAAAKIIIDSLTALEDTLHNSKIKAGEDGLRYPIKLEEKLTDVNVTVQNADAKPTQSDVDVFNDLSQKIDAQLARLNTIIQQKVVPFNQMAAGKQKPVIDISDKTIP